jgi:ATP-dependent DNA helicase RecG
MEDQELEQLLKDLESDRVERKSSTADKNKIRQAICAFANDLPNHRLPGVIFIGVDDNGNCVGLPITDQMLRELADARETVLPFASIVVQKRSIQGCEIAVVIVQPSDAPPIRFEGRVWIRVGPSRRIATLEEERRLSEKRRSRDISFDLTPVPSLSLDDLDLEMFERTYVPSAVSPEILEQNERSIEQQLISMRFATPTEPPMPTILGVLVVGIDPRITLPGAYVQFLRLDGSDLTTPIKDQKEISGPLPQLLITLDEIFRAHISVASDFTSGSTENRSPDYPLVSLQQVARNAILHRNYETTNAPVRISWFDDRVEIQSPGGPFGQVNKQNFGQPGITDYRNPFLAEAMKNLGFVQRFGAGIPITKSQLQKNGNPDPEFIVEDAHILVILRRRS